MGSPATLQRREASWRLLRHLPAGRFFVALARARPALALAAKIDGTPWGDSGLWQALARACKRVGISGSRYHSLRHFFATQRYAHHDKERAREAVKVFSLV